MADFTKKQREKLADEKEAMPDGSYPIRNRSDLKNAIQAFGRSKNPEKTKAWIKKRARELDAEDLIPESWLEHMDDSVYLVHYGVKGMKWNIRKKQEELAERVLALKNRKNNQRVKYKLTDFKDRSSLEKNQEKTIDQQSNEELIADIENRKKEIVALTNDLVDMYKQIKIQKINTQRSIDRAAMIIKKFKIKKATII